MNPIKQAIIIYDLNTKQYMYPINLIIRGNVTKKYPLWYKYVPLKDENTVDFCRKTITMKNLKCEGNEKFIKAKNLEKKNESII